MKRLLAVGLCLSGLLLGVLACAPKETMPDLHKGPGPDVRDNRSVPHKNPNVIVPGYGIEERAEGGLCCGLGLGLGAERAMVEETWGTPDDVYENPFDPTNIIVGYHDRGVEISYKNNVVSCITLHSQKDNWKAYPGATDYGVSLESNREDIISAMGEPVKKATLALEYPGLTVSFNEDGTVDYLSVVALPDKTDQVEKSSKDKHEASSRPEEMHLDLNIDTSEKTSEGASRLRQSADQVLHR